MPKVSIVLPTYNGEKYLEESVMSCLNQTMGDFELIIVDDCSTDTTPDIIKRLSLLDDRIHSVRNETNMKLPASLNRGFSLAKGDYYTWTSDDNLYHECALEKMSHFLDHNQHVDLVYCNEILINNEGTITGTSSLLPPSHIVRHNCVGSCFMFTREVFQKLGGYDTSLFLVEDYDFWLRAAAEFQLAHLNEGLYYYRIHDDSLTGKKKYKILWLTNALLLKRIPALKNIPKWILFKAYFFIVIRYIRSVIGIIFTSRK
ncbi:glycosyltransferase [Bacillus timonensis]|nr:glycosyltransferase [Bacillus timonensis]